MKKKLRLSIAAAMVILSVTACGGKAEPSAQPAETTSAGTSSRESTEETAAQTTEEEAARETTAEEETTGMPASMGQGIEMEVKISDSEIEEKNERMAALEKADYKGFAEKVQKAFADKDIDALAELIAYPVYVEANDGVIVEDKEQFKKMSGSVFTEELVKVIGEVDVSKLEVAQAGVVMSDEEATLSVIFGSDTKGNMGITEIKSVKE